MEMHSMKTIRKIKYVMLGLTAISCLYLALIWPGIAPPVIDEALIQTSEGIYKCTIKFIIVDLVMYLENIKDLDAFL
jgi:hypothetical protein